MKTLIFTVVFVAMNVQELSAQKSQQVISRPNASLMKSVIDFYGAEKLSFYRFEVTPSCVGDRHRYACAAHDPGTVAVALSVGNTSKQRPGYTFALSPVRDSSGLKTISLFTSAKDVSPGFTSLTMTEFEVSADGNRVVKRRNVVRDLVSSK